MVYSRILDMVGNTPVVEVPPFIHETDNVLLAKLEYFNPTRSLKDRVALAMIEDAEKRGLLTQGVTIIEPTSGNMGISLAFVCAIKGYKLVLTMSEAMSIERRKMIAYFGADLVLTDKSLGFSGAINKAYELASNMGDAVVLNQYENDANFRVHQEQTGKEIWEQVGSKLDIFIAGAGTGACVSGVSSYIKERHKLYTVCVEPEESNILSGGERFKPHSIQGIGPDFIPGNFKKEFIDEVFHVSKEDAFHMAHVLANKAGIGAGISGGATAACALQKARKCNGKTLLFIVADFCERYLSTDLFE